MRRAITKTLAVLACVVATLGVLESLLLIGGFDRPPPPSPLPAQHASLRVEGRLLHELDARELWKPIAGAQTPWGDRLSSAGFRSSEVARERRAGVARIAAIGDACAFGRGVPADACWVRKAADVLAARGVACEAIDAGVVGHTVRQGVERFELDVAAWKPDVVVAAFAGVEEHAPAVALDDDALIESGVVARASPLAERVRRELKLAHLLAWIAGRPSADASDRARPDRTDRPDRADRVGEDVDVAGDPAWTGVRRVSLERFSAELARLDERVRAAGARLVLLAPPRQARVVRAAPVLDAYRQATFEAGKALGVPVVDGVEPLAAAVKAGATLQDLLLGPDEPTALGHERIGVAVAEVLEPMLRGR